MKLRELPVFFLDLQTTGANPNSGEILEIAWAGKNSTIRSYVVQQEGGYVPYRIQAITGITDHDLISAKSVSDVHNELLETIPKDAYCIIHYSRFEIPFLKGLFSGDLPFPVLCTHEIAKKMYPNLPTRSLRGFAGFFGYQKEELKRSKSHVEATAIIWDGLVENLEKEGIETLEQLESWLAFKDNKKKSGFEYPLPKEKRLSLPKSPGIYRMLNKKGEVLYVGKATSLHSRVNSYFRGQKNRDPRKLEMLTQVWDIECVECRSPLEAALLETDEIKRLDPPYNVNLKLGQRGMVFFSRDFSSCSPQQDEIHQVGPFSSPLVLDSLKRLNRSLNSQQFDEDIFFDPIPERLLEEGFHLFCLRHEIEKEQLKSTRSLIAFGLHLWRKQKVEIQSISDQLSDDMNTPLLEEDIDENECAILTAIDVADKFERHFVRGARAYLRARAMTRLLNCDVEYYPDWNNHQTMFRLSFNCGKPSESTVKRKRANLPWVGLSVEDYDRMAILYSELAKVKAREIRIL